MSMAEEEITFFCSKWGITFYTACLPASKLYANLNLYNYRLTQTLIIPINTFPIL